MPCLQTKKRWHTARCSRLSHSSSRQANFRKIFVPTMRKQCSTPSRQISRTSVSMDVISILPRHCGVKCKKKPYQRFVSSAAVRESYKKLKLLCYVPVSDVLLAYEHVSQTCPAAFQPMLTYFVTYWIGKPVRNKPGMRKVPSFPIPTWNFYTRQLRDEAKTNNSIEAWHVYDHPTLNNCA